MEVAMSVCLSSFTNTDMVNTDMVTVFCLNNSLCIILAKIVHKHLQRKDLL